MACLDAPAQRFPKNPSLHSTDDTLKFACQIGVMNGGQAVYYFSRGDICGMRSQRGTDCQDDRSRPSLNQILEVRLKRVPHEGPLTRKKRFLQLKMYRPSPTGRDSGFLFHRRSP